MKVSKRNEANQYKDEKVIEFPLSSTAIQARQTKQQFAKPEEYLSFELGQAVKELPPLYTRLLAASISLLVFGAIAWAHFSQVDEVVVAAGELIPSTQVRPVRSLQSGVIRVIKVKEGDRVKKDQILVERDPELPQTEVDRLDKTAKLIREDISRLEAERVGIKNTGTALQDQLLTARLTDFEARLASAIAEANKQAAIRDEAKVRLTRLQENFANAKINQANAETNLANISSLLPKMESNLAIAQKKEQSLQPLVKDGAVPRLDYFDIQERLIRSQAEVTRSQDEITTVQNKVTEAKDKVISLEKDIDAQQQQILQAEQAYQAAKKLASRLASERQGEILTQLNKRKEEQATVEGQLKQAKVQRRGETITAPVAGTVYSIKATKGPVQSGEELLSILPDGEEVLLEVKVLNRDIGFIQEGMKAKVKMVTFPFQEFGTIDGNVVKVSPNAIADKELGLVFPTRIKLNKHSITVKGKEVQFTSGMVASGEIVTRRKSVLTFLIEPITRRFSEAFSVR